MSARLPSKLFVLSAPSGTGKTTLINTLLAKLSGIRVAVTHTTRPPRSGEVHGRDYHFVSPETFQDLIQSGQMLEWAKVFDYDYGTSKLELDLARARQEDLILNLDWQGAQAIRSQFPDDAVTIFLIPPSLAELERRLQKRGKDSLASIEKRLALAAIELSHQHEYDDIIINDNFDIALNELIQLITRYR